MMSFEDYGTLYDTIYKEKDYSKETDYVLSILQKFKPGAKSIAEFGCGTGKHAEALARLGLNVFGIDRSDSMLEGAARRKESLPAQVGERLQFQNSDIRSFQTSENFDAVVSLFHVMSYQTSDDDLNKAFHSAYECLKPDGVLIFDSWYGPAVLNDPPFEKEQGYCDPEIGKFIKKVKPIHDPESRRYNIHFRLQEGENGEGRLISEETHRMRYLFEPEVKQMLIRIGFRDVQVFDWLKFDLPTTQSWNACFVACR